MFVDVAAYGTARLNVSVDSGGGTVEPTAEGQLVSGSYFQLLGVNPVAGRTIGLADDVNPNGHPVAVISHGYWKRRFGLDASVLGRTIHLSGTPFTIVGVAPPEFFGLEVGRAPDIWVPTMMQPAVMPAAENWLGGGSIARTFWLTVVGRVKPEYTPQHAQAMVAGLDVLLPMYTKPANRGERPQLIPERLALSPAATGISSLRQQFSQPLLVLMAVVAVVLLIACANVANLVLARAATRLPEFSMRLALGAGRWRLVRQLLVENVILATLGGFCGLLLARWATGVLVTFMSSGRTPIVLHLEPDARILAFTAVVSILTGLMCGLAPALRASRIDVISGIKGQARGSIGGGRWLGPGRSSSSRRWSCACSCSSRRASSCAACSGSTDRMADSRATTCSSSESSQGAATSAACQARPHASTGPIATCSRASARFPASAPPAWRTTVRPLAWATQVRSSYPTAPSREFRR